MNIPKIKRDELSNKVLNKEEIIDFIKYVADTDFLDKYKYALTTQGKVPKSEVEDLINEIDNRIKLHNKYEEIRNDKVKLEVFFKEIFKYLKSIYNRLHHGDVSNDLKNMLISFLNICITKEEQGIQNDLEMQNLFDEIINNREFGVELWMGKDFSSSIGNIIKRKEALLNRNSTEEKVLTLTPKVNNEVNGKGFIMTAIVLEGSLALGLILSLIALFK